MPLVVEKVQNWLSSGEPQVFVIGMYLREKPKKLGYIYSEVGDKTPNCIRFFPVTLVDVTFSITKAISRTTESVLDILTIYCYCFTSVRIN